MRYPEGEGEEGTALYQFPPGLKAAQPNSNMVLQMERQTIEQKKGTRREG